MEQEAKKNETNSQKPFSMKEWLVSKVKDGLEYVKKHKVYTALTVVCVIGVIVFECTGMKPEDVYSNEEHTLEGFLGIRFGENVKKGKGHYNRPYSKRLSWGEMKEYLKDFEDYYVYLTPEDKVYKIRTASYDGSESYADDIYKYIRKLLEQRFRIPFQSEASSEGERDKIVMKFRKKGFRPNVCQKIELCKRACRRVNGVEESWYVCIDVIDRALFEEAKDQWRKHDAMALATVPQ